MKNSNSFALLLRRPSLLAEIDQERASRSLREFVRQAWLIIEPSTPFVPGWHIDAIIEHLEAISLGYIRNLLINVPPRHMKSLLVSVLWPAWEWIRSPERRFLYSSYAAQLSIRDSVKCRRLIESPWYQDRWGDRFALTGDQNTKGRFENDRSGYRLSTSVGGAATGEGGDRVVCDDPHNVQEAESDSVRKATLDWWDVVMSTRVNDPRSAAKVVVMQRCHQLDLSGHLLEQGGWEYLRLPAEYEKPGCSTSIGWSDPRTEQNELLWAERFGPTELETLKRSLGSYAAAGQLQQRPSPAGGGIIKRHWFRYFQPRGMNLPPVVVSLPDGTQMSIVAIEAPQRVDEQIQSWDCAFKDLGTSDYVVGQVWARLGSAFLLGDQVRARMDCPATVHAVRQLTAKWPATIAKLIEDKANGSAVIQMLSRDIPGLLPVNPEGGKVARAAAVSPLIEAGNIYLPHPLWAPWVNDFIEECAAFPNGAHDDQVDAMTQALLRWHMVVPQQEVICYSRPYQISPI
ncbi:MAG: phage terminase large subunit [Bryobacteraceae bacterium]|jgi:predicted phage terminase large subunit-like protein